MCTEKAIITNQVYIRNVITGICHLYLGLVWGQVVHGPALSQVRGLGIKSKMDPPPLSGGIGVMDPERYIAS